MSGERGPTTEELRASARATGPRTAPVTGELAQLFGSLTGPSRFAAAIFVNTVRLLVASGETPDSLEWLLAETLADLERHVAGTGEPGRWESGFSEQVARGWERGTTEAARPPLDSEGAERQ